MQICPEHGLMARRDERRLTAEQRYCGEWWDCVRCTSSVLIPSPELAAVLGIAPATKEDFNAR